MNAAPPQPLLVRALRDPRSLAALDLPGWSLVLRQAERADMQATLLALIEDAGLLNAVPPAPRAHLDWIRAGAMRHVQAAHNEVRHIARALDGLGLPVILLKGAAYAMAGLEAGRGRRFSDIDILVPKARLADVEAALMRHGWATTHHDAYDQRYYREWMHELPPMEHVLRGNVIDVHHAILPETAAARPDPDKLRACAVPVAHAIPNLAMLAPHDMLLHSAVHLFGGGEFDHGLRDLFDIHRLLGQFGRDLAFWDGLAARARELRLGRSLFYALRYSTRVFGTAVPQEVLRAAAVEGPGAPGTALMDSLFLRALQPPHPSCAGPLTAPALGMLYLRGNWLRMPPLLLARHLFHKAFISKRQGPVTA
jgi:hypothetical protein